MREITGEHVWTAPEVEAETVDGYFMPWQGGNAKLNAFWKAQNLERERQKAWWANYGAKEAPDG